MQSSSSLQKALEDTQASLATALGRIEAYRIREKFLLQENYKLRQELKRTDGQSLEAALQTTVSRRYRTGAMEETVKEEKEVHDFHRREGINYRLHEEYPILLHTSKGKVQASLSANPECIEVFESKARISSTQFVGMTNLSTDKMSSQTRSPKLAMKGWTAFLFGKSKTAEDVESPKDDFHKRWERRSASPTGPPDLERSSWNGKSEMRRMSVDEARLARDQTSVWQVLWKDGGGGSKLKQLVFEAGVAAQSFINRTIENWSDAASRAAVMEEASDVTKTPIVEDCAESELTSGASLADEGVIVPPKHLIPDGPFPGMSGKSELITEELVRCMTGAMPPRFRHSAWSLLYSTDKHGISLQTLYRKTTNISPTVLIIKDASDFVFGAYCSEPWKMGPRFFGTGETFVFQLEPHRVYYPWKQDSTVRNNFFMFASLDSLGVGGSGHFSIWLDSELLNGHSGLCDTFGSPCLAAKEEFKIMKLELWGLM